MPWLLADELADQALATHAYQTFMRDHDPSTAGWKGNPGGDLGDCKPRIKFRCNFETLATCIVHQHRASPWAHCKPSAQAFPALSCALSTCNALNAHMIVLLTNGMGSHVLLSQLACFFCNHIFHVLLTCSRLLPLAICFPASQSHGMLLLSWSECCRSRNE